MLLGWAFYWEGVIYLKALQPYHFVSQFLHPATSRNDLLTDHRELDRVYGKISSHTEIEWQVFMDGMISNRKQLMHMMNTVMHGQPMQLSIKWGDKIQK